jgi:hypothetical protein
MTTSEQVTSFGRQRREGGFLKLTLFKNNAFIVLNLLHDKIILALASPYAYVSLRQKLASLTGSTPLLRIRMLRHSVSIKWYNCERAEQLMATR